jgi:hypothetical protein
MEESKGEGWLAQSVYDELDGAVGRVCAHSCFGYTRQRGSASMLVLVLVPVLRGPADGPCIDVVEDIRDVKRERRTRGRVGGQEDGGLTLRVMRWHAKHVVV